ncbi:hypothetical protein [Pseudomonas sp. PLMAX]|uniref:hypothetical protein n=1 Tax=Pseudomonas sp. PLMAX TaxID=2201998 RepID=UPI0038BD7D9B
MSEIKLPKNHAMTNNPRIQAIRDFLYEPDGAADLSKFQLGAGQQKERNELFAAVRHEIPWFLSPGVGIGNKEEKSKRAVELLAAVIDGVSHAYPEEMKHSAQLEFLSNGFTERSAVLKTLIVMAPQFEHFKGDLFRIDLGV